MTTFRRTNGCPWATFSQYWLGLMLLSLGCLVGCGSNDGNPKLTEVLELFVAGGNENENMSTLAYNGNKLASVSHNDNSVTVTYSGNELISAIPQGQGKNWSIDYTSGLPTKLTLSQGGGIDAAEVLYRGDAVSKVVWSGDFRNDTITYTLDGERIESYTVESNSRVSQFTLTYSGSELTQVQRELSGNFTTVKFEYNSAKQVTKVITSTRTYEVDYDKHGRIARVITATNADNYTQYTYKYQSGDAVGFVPTPHFDHGDLFDLHGRVQEPYSMLSSALLFE